MNASTHLNWFLLEEIGEIYSGCGKCVKVEI